MAGGVCVAGGMHGGGCAWWRVCVAGGMHRRGACVMGRHAWQEGMHGREGGMRGKGRAWQIL